MSRILLFATAAIGLWLAGGCQMGLSSHLSILGAMPDFPIILIGTLGLFLGRSGAAMLGCIAGVSEGAVSGANLASYAVSRALIGFLVGWFNAFEIEASPFLAMFVTAALTIIAQLALMFVAPPGSILSYLAATIGGAVYNGVLAMPFYALLKRMLAPHE